MANLIISGGVTLSGGFDAGVGSGANNEPTLSVLSGLYGWFKADSLALADGANVTVWGDQSGAIGSSDFQQAGAIATPLYAASSINGLPAIRNELSYYSGGRALVMNRKIPYSHTIFIVAKASASASGMGTLYSEQTNYAADVSAIAMRWNNGEIKGYHSMNLYSVEQPVFGSVGTNPFILTTATVQDTSYTHYLNGTQAAQVLGTAMNTNVSGPSSKTYLFNFYAWNFIGDISEFIVYDRALTTQELASVHAYLGAKYAISV